MFMTIIAIMLLLLIIMSQLDHVSRLSGVTCLQWAEVLQVSTKPASVAGRVAGSTQPVTCQFPRDIQLTIYLLIK